MPLSKIKVAVVFWRLGPYHHARLGAAGRAVDLYGLEACGMEQTYAWEKVEGGEHFHRITLTDTFSNDRRWRQQLRRRMFVELGKIKPDVLAVPGWSLADALAALQWGVKNRVPVVTMSESTEWDEARTVWKEWMKRRIVGLCSAALVGGRPHKDYMVRLGMPAERVFLGYDAVDNDYFAAETAKWRKQKIENRNQKSEGKNQFQLSAFPISTFENTPFFLASARFIEKKNLPRLIQAYARYRELAQIEDGRSKMEVGGGKAESGKQKAEIWNLVLLGDGPLRKEIELRIADCGLRNSVLLPGFKQYPDLPAYYAHAGAFIHASTTEQWGLVVNEAMASGLPVLVSNRCGCAAELVQEGVNGFTFDPLNVEQLAQLMLRISDFRYPISDFGVASARIIAGWGPERFASGLMQAAECALRAGPVNPSLLQRTILNALLQK